MAKVICFHAQLNCAYFQTDKHQFAFFFFAVDLPRPQLAAAAETHRNHRAATSFGRQQDTCHI